MYHNLKLYPEGRFRKSAAVVGEVMAKYHPHGDSSIYDAMVRMAQPFSLRHPLIEGQGNFGSLMVTILLPWGIQKLNKTNSNKILWN